MGTAGSVLFRELPLQCHTVCKTVQVLQLLWCVFVLSIPLLQAPSSDSDPCVVMTGEDFLDDGTPIRLKITINGQEVSTVCRFDVHLGCT